MVQQTDIESDNSPEGTQVSTELDITITSGVQFENETPISPPKSVSKEPAKYVSKVTIQLGGYTKEPNRKLSSSHASPLPQRKSGSDSFSASEINSSRDSLSRSMISQVAKHNVEGTPRTSTPEPRTNMTRRYGQQNVSGIHREDILSGMDKTRKLFYDSEATKDIDSTEVLNQESINRLPLDVTTQYSRRDEFSKTTWYFDILQRVEDLSWSYQNLDTEYSFLEKLNKEQKEDLRKAKSWSKHLRNQNASHRANKVY